MNETVTCIRLDRMTQFHSFYRNSDVLLMDDIHILGGKERTQEEFFHTFNELYDHQKQIVISSDSTPKEIPGLVERLRSRFEWGLMVDMQPPDLETKMAILDKKAEAEGIKLPEDVRIFMATKTKSNVRELEGALVKLIAYSSLTGAPITMQMAQQSLKHMVRVKYANKSPPANILPRLHSPKQVHAVTFGRLSAPQPMLRTMDMCASMRKRVGQPATLQITNASVYSRRRRQW